MKRFIFILLLIIASSSVHASDTRILKEVIIQEKEVIEFCEYIHKNWTKRRVRETTHSYPDFMWAFFEYRKMGIKFNEIVAIKHTSSDRKFCGFCPILDAEKMEAQLLQQEKRVIHFITIVSNGFEKLKLAAGGSAFWEVPAQPVLKLTMFHQDEILDIHESVYIDHPVMRQGQMSEEEYHLKRLSDPNVVENIKKIRESLDKLEQNKEIRPDTTQRYKLSR